MPKCKKLSSVHGLCAEPMLVSVKEFEMNNTFKSMIVVGTLFSCSSAFAGLSSSEAYSECKQSVKSFYGSDARVKLMKVRSAKKGVKNVKVRVTVNGEKSVLSCGINKTGAILAVNNIDGSPIAGFISQAQ
ncbi:MAG: hypothetical protein ACI92E_002755 [Oceanicoccus sp.]|jgi:hypothetical protein